MSQSNSIGALFKLIGIKVSNSRYNEDNLKTLLKKFEQTIASKKTAETDNRFLRDKLDEVMITTILYLTLLLQADKDIFNLKKKIKAIVGNTSVDSKEENPYLFEEEDDINIVEVATTFLFLIKFR